jgi:hypothetical protein
MARWGIMDCGEGIDLASPAEPIFRARLSPTIRANISRRKDLHIAMRAHLAHQGVSLLAKPPVP